MAFYMSPNGSDMNPGTLDLPFLTLSRAVGAARGADSGKEILLLDGEYEDARVELDERDCGLTIRPAEGGEPVLRGGIKIDGWRKVGGDLYTVVIPQEVTEDVRLLEIDGRLALRAKFPQNGRIKHRSEFPSVWMSTSMGGWDIKPTKEQLQTLIYGPEVLPDGFNWRGAELTVFHRWDASFTAVSAVDSANRLLELSPPCGHPPGAFETKEYIIWNTELGMEPGCWRFDRKERTLYYRAIACEDMRRAAAYIPRSDTVIRIRGSVKDLTIKGIVFKTTAPPMAPNEFGASGVPGAIDSDGVLSGCIFSGLTFQNIGGWGIRLNGVNVNVSVDHCGILDSGAGGIMLMSGNHCAVSSNRVERIGKTYFSSIGVYVQGEGCEITGNMLDELPYTGIAYGLIPARGCGCKIEGNRVANAMRVLNDGAGIYATHSHGGVMRGNIVKNIPQSGNLDSSRNGLYLDEESENWLVEGNLTEDCTSAMMNHMASGNILRDNVFCASNGDLLISFIRCKDYTLERNTFHSFGKVTIAGRKGAVPVFERNLAYSAEGQIAQVYVGDDYSRSQPVKFNGENVL